MPVMGGLFWTIPGWPDPVSSVATPVAWCVCVLSEGFVTGFDLRGLEPDVRIWGVTVRRLPDT